MNNVRLLAELLLDRGAQLLVRLRRLDLDLGLAGQLDELAVVMLTAKGSIATAVAMTGCRLNRTTR